MSEKSSEIVRQWAIENCDRSFDILGLRLAKLASLIDAYAAERAREARLDEAKWWAGGMHFNQHPSCDRCKRIAELESNANGG